MSNDNDCTFVRITNADIYKIIQDNNKSNTRQHEEILDKLESTRSIAKKAQLVSSAAIGLSLIVLGYMVSYLLKVAG